MNQRRNGFATILLILGIAGLIALANFAYTKYEVSKIQNAKNLGAQVLTTNLTDTIGTFRTNVNTSLANLNTDIATITSTQATYGNIVTQNTPLANNKGGTGTTTTPTDLQYFGANGSTVAYLTLKAGSGITITTSTTSTVISTPGFDNTANISFTGNNTHAGSETFSSTTVYTKATSSALTTDASGTVIGIQASTTGNFLGANGTSWISTTVVKKTMATSSVTLAQNTTSTLVTSTLPSLASINTVYHFFLTIVGNNGNNTATTTISFNNSGATTTIYAVNVNLGNTTGFTAEGNITMLGSASSEFINLPAGTALSPTTGAFNTFSLNLATTTTVTVQADLTSNTSPTETTELIIYAL